VATRVEAGAGATGAAVGTVVEEGIAAGDGGIRP
jgi:hypothetical protein